ncbi:uncharacterized protein LOC119076796 [Bradysia coprophila]|uniref:uncharacterized protein LOC119076796 n=1 Tax=Bradysia coprophila TaxID=38358 RepID=UPI00187DC9C2|nr:uncharacterized protein LOC119076796 [Bradysia coprophila]
MKVSAIIVLIIVSLTVFTDAQMMKDQSSGDDWSMSGLDSTPMLKSEQVKSLSLDDIDMNSDTDDSFDISTTGKGRREREVRAFFDLILNILETIRGPAKNDIRRKDN